MALREDERRPALERIDVRCWSVPDPSSMDTDTDTESEFREARSLRTQHAPSALAKSPKWSEVDVNLGKLPLMRGRR